ncbi:hypothetical protein DFH07DRAFT_1063624 [Mycena maculata]|uniref:Bacteriophage T5 Orf172 DNA-binding domain-containing protein n=1 Tax=Mycena maculata TaxID=230809 RepID=A0AAD7N2J7_9AGAR|nr:hypothetical protein DFH07DRAFT_1063624 [Mycena maculata]
MCATHPPQRAFAAVHLRSNTQPFPPHRAPPPRRLPLSPACPHPNHPRTRRAHLAIVPQRPGHPAPRPEASPALTSPTAYKIPARRHISCFRTTTTTTTTTAVTERLSLGNLATNVLALLAAVLVVTTLVLTSRIVRAPVPAGQLFRYHCARVGLRLIFTTPPTLAQIGALPLLARLAAFAEFPGRFAREGCGAVYVTAVVEDYFLGLFYSGQMNAAEFLGHMRVKVGHTADLPSRRKGYSKCNVAQTHLWLFCFHPRQRMATERMCHICFDMKDTRAYLVCSCNVEHQEYWWLQNIGGFGEVEACIRRVLDALGESDAPREDLQNAWITTLRG